jgi:hypothetical protein
LLPTRAAVKRGLGVGAILLLTPLAVLVAFGVSCAATMVIVESPLVNNLNQAIVVGLAVFVGPPVVVLGGMIWWAVRARAIRRHEVLNQTWNRAETNNPDSDSTA